MFSEEARCHRWHGIPAKKLTLNDRIYGLFQLLDFFLERMQVSFDFPSKTSDKADGHVFLLGFFLLKYDCESKFHEHPPSHMIRLYPSSPYTSSHLPNTRSSTKRAVFK